MVNTYRIKSWDRYVCNHDNSRLVLYLMLYAPAPSSCPIPDRLASKSWTSPDSITSSVRGSFRAHAMMEGGGGVGGACAALGNNLSFTPVSHNLPDLQWEETRGDYYHAMCLHL